MKKKTTEQYIHEANIVHNNRYDYSKTLYRGSNTSIEITCIHHGDFKIIAKNHITKKTGCPICTKENKGSCSLTTNEFINKANIIHKGLYVYDRVDYKHSHTKIEIGCKLHGYFLQRPNDHIRKARPQGCYKCGRLELSLSKTKSAEQFINKASHVHGNKYNYDSVDYVHSRLKVDIDCPVHGIFKQRPHDHENGRGCPKCKALRSKNEILCEKLIKTIYGSRIQIKSSIHPIELKRITTQGPGLEIDMEILNSKGDRILLIEWNGIYWHSRKHIIARDIQKKTIYGDMLLQIIDPGSEDPIFVENIVNTKIVPLINKLIV